MDLKVLYDQEVNALNILTDEAEKEDTCIPLRGEGSVVLGVAYGDMCHIVSIEALGASAWLPLGKRDYDAETDTLTIGVASEDEVLVTENEDIVGIGCRMNLTRPNSWTPSASHSATPRSTWGRCKCWGSSARRDAGLSIELQQRPLMRFVSGSAPLSFDGKDHLRAVISGSVHQRGDLVSLHFRRLIRTRTSDSASRSSTSWSNQNDSISRGSITGIRL